MKYEKEPKVTTEADIAWASSEAYKIDVARWQRTAEYWMKQANMYVVELTAEQEKFRGETRYTSMLTQRIAALLKAIYDMGGEIGPNHPDVLAANRAIHEPVNCPTIPTEQVESALRGLYNAVVDGVAWGTIPNDEPTLDAVNKARDALTKVQP